MKNHRHLKNSKLLHFSALVVLAVLCVPLVLSASTTHGAASLLCAGLPMIGALRMEEAKEPGADAVGIPDAIRAIEDKTMPMSQRLGVALKALQGVDPTNQLATLKADLDKAKGDVTAKDGEITKLKADLEAANKRITALDTDVKQHDDERAKAEKEAADLRAKEQDIDKRAESKSKEKVAALGFPASQLPAATDKPGAGTYAEALEQYGKITDPAKAADFYAKSIQPHLDNPRGPHGLN